jgi:hypothetical protein
VGARSTGVVFENWNWGFVRIGSKNVVGGALFWRLGQQLGLNDGSGVRWLDCELSVRKSMIRTEKAQETLLTHIQDVH